MRKAGVELAEHNSPAAVSIQVLTGRVRVTGQEPAEVDSPPSRASTPPAAPSALGSAPAATGLGLSFPRTGR